MKMKDAMAIIDIAESGFMVTFEKVEGESGGILASDHFPDKHAGEPLIKTEHEAWELANRFARATHPDKIVNIYVIEQDFVPVKGYAGKIIRRR